MEILLFIDTACFHFINSTLSNPIFDFIMPLFHHEKYLLPMIMILWMCAVCYDKPNRWKLAIIPLVIILVDQSGVWIKNTVSRPRPFQVMDPAIIHHLVAPSGAGSELRKQYKAGKGIPGLFAIEQDYTGDCRAVALSYCRAIGLTRMGVFESTFKEETETDLFGEQIILTGGIPKLIQSSYKVLLEEGYSPVTAWFVCYYELKTIVDMFHSKGFEFMNSSISDTAEYGGITRGKRIIDKHVEDEMRKALKEIQSGQFHREWQKEAEAGFPTLSKLREEEKHLPIEKIGNIILKELFDKK